MTLTIRRASTKTRVLQYGTVACTLLKDIGNASNQPYLQAIASVSLLIMETVQRVKDNKDACVKMTERAYELVCAIINICRDSEAELAPAMVRSITQFSETLEKILAFVRSQVKGGIWRRILRSMEDADLITECNQGLKHALDVFGVQSGIIAAMTMAEMQKDATKRHEELITILKEKRSRPKRSSTDDSSGSRSSRRKRPSSANVNLIAISMLPASPKIFYGRDEEVKHVVNTVLRSKPARICVAGAEGIGKTAVAVAAAHSPELGEMFGVQRYFVDCEGARDGKMLVATIAATLQLEGRGRKHVVRHLEAIATEEKPALLILDALDRSWRPHENRSDIEDFLSLLADIQYLTLIVTVRGGERPRQVRWTRPFLPTMCPLPVDAARATFLDISDAPSDDPGLDALLTLTEYNPGTLTHMAGLASFEGCAALVARWEAEGGALLMERAERAIRATDMMVPIFGGGFTDEPEEMGEQKPPVAGPVSEQDIMALLEGIPECPKTRMPSIDSLLSGKERGFTRLGSRDEDENSLESLLRRSTSTLVGGGSPSSTLSNLSLSHTFDSSRSSSVLRRGSSDTLSSVGTLHSDTSCGSALQPLLTLRKDTCDSVLGPERTSLDKLCTLVAPTTPPVRVDTT
ncbi:hypothetical protein C8R43DRAFT_5084 [Mycena crocata]|nr:hypothetical protein C8R43DRAFT_5084 [Mycena crocata]